MNVCIFHQNLSYKVIYRGVTQIEDISDFLIGNVRRVFKGRIYTLISQETHPLLEISDRVCDLDFLEGLGHKLKSTII